jgi:predicted O-methyltransferase YrrM
MPSWWSANLKNRSLFALRNPRYTIKSVVRDLFAADERFLARITGCASSSIRSYLNEPFKHAEFMARIREAEQRMRNLNITSADCYGKRVLLQYAVVRAVKPDLIVETGVANGISCSYLLLALHMNNKGALHSIEIGDASYLPSGHLNGWAVPEWLRDQWSMHVGDSRVVLPDLLSKLGKIDIFIHDSLHTYEHMKFEYEESYPYLRSGGILISDDALWNKAFPDFARQNDGGAWQILRGVGVMKKGE